MLLALAYRVARLRAILNLHGSLILHGLRAKHGIGLTRVRGDAAEPPTDTPGARKESR